MIIVPELRTVVLLVPRAASGSLKRAVIDAYPRAMLLYRHMEASEIPYGYADWEKVGVVRDPLERLWSLYKYLKDDRERRRGGRYAAFWERMYQSVQRPFEDWLLNNREMFLDGNHEGDLSEKWPYCAVRMPMPENFKSQRHYLRPDLGTFVCRFDRLHEIEKVLGVELQHRNVSNRDPVPALSQAAEAHMEEYFHWDLKVTA